MAILCGVIQHMVDQGISPAPDKETKAVVLPVWMESMRKCLADFSRHRNVRLFLLKLILNVKSEFRPYAHHWVNSVLKVRHTETHVLYFKEHHSSCLSISYTF
jgi:hypothetical protein